MKIRNGFVSNSSSSSFVIIGKRISTPLKALQSGKKVLVYVDGGGTSGEAEDWAMFLDKETYAILQGSKWFNRMNDVEYWEVEDGVATEYDSKSGEEMMVVENDVVDETFFGFRRDYSSPNNKKQLLQFLEDVE
jgi:hypothetical protein